MLFYHVELARTKPIEIFIPRIPDERLVDEDDVIPRICVSTSIIGCLNAVPWGKRNLDFIPDFLPIRVYVFETDKFWSSSELYNDGLVADAIYTDEHWLLEPIMPKEIFYINNLKINLKDIILDTKKHYSIIDKLDYNIIDESAFSKKINLKNFKSLYKNEKDFDFILDYIINNFFDFDNYYINDYYMDENSILNIDSSYLFDKYSLLCLLEDDFLLEEIFNEWLI